MSLTELTVQQFTATTASGEPVPGGGSISALCGALAAALGEMVTHLTIGKKKYADVQNIMEEIAAKLAPASGILLKAVDMDAQAYDMVFQAYKMPKGTEEEIESRNSMIQEALKHAANVPFSVAKMVNTFLPDLMTIALSGNQNAITDAYVATMCARTAVLGAAANSRINLSSINDAEFVDAMVKDLAEIEANANAAEKGVADLLKKALA